MIGPWIRPVSAHGEGELLPAESMLTNGKQPKVFDFVEVQLSHKQNDPLQPENWLIDPSVRWKSVNSVYAKPDYSLLIDSMQSVWLEPNGRQDRVSATFLKGVRQLNCSLRLIHVPSLQARFEWNEWDGRYKQRRRGAFRYNEVDYEFNITDPAFSERHRDKFPAKGQPANMFSVAPPNGCYLCVSLAPEFNGYHYKVIATVLEG